MDEHESGGQLSTEMVKYNKKVGKDRKKER